jgi:hypothetical protein
VVQVVAAFVLDGGAGGRVADAVIVVDNWVVDGERHTFLDHERVGVAVDRWVYAQAEEVLVVWCEDPWSDSRAVGRGFGRVGLRRSGGEDPGCADFKGE